MKAGLTNHCNTYLPYDRTVNLHPFIDKSGMNEIPYGWEDDVDIMTTDRNVIDEILQMDFAVFDFHPIHVYLNSPSMALYEATRGFHADKHNLEKSIHIGYGTRTAFEYLLESLCK